MNTRACSFATALAAAIALIAPTATTLSELPRHLEREAADELETVRAAWPDWWSDGVGSAPREAAAARVTQARLTAVEGLDALARLTGAPPDEELRRRLDWARERLVLYGEHTWGGALYWVTRYGKDLNWSYGDAWRAERAAGRFERLGPIEAA